MPSSLKWLLNLPRGRLSRRIALWVFISVIVIETIIFFPSFHNRKKELLAQIREISTAKISVMMQLARGMNSNEALMKHFRIEQIYLEPGDILVGYTDGVTEARSPADSLFGRKRLEALLDQAGGAAEDLIAHIRSSLFDYVGNAPQEDDITLLAVRRSPEAVSRKEAEGCG